MHTLKRLSVLQLNVGIEMRTGALVRSAQGSQRAQLFEQLFGHRRENKLYNAKTFKRELLKIKTCSFTLY